MITVYDHENKIIASGENQVSADCLALDDEIILYIDFSGADGDTLQVFFDVYNDTAQEWFPIQQDTGTSIVNYQKTLSPGKYRIMVPLAQNEQRIKIDLTSSSATAEIKVWVIPNK